MNENVLTPETTNVAEKTRITGIKTRYSDEELEEFREIILEKIKKAKDLYYFYRGNCANNEGNGTDDTSPKLKSIEDAQLVVSQDNSDILANRQLRFFRQLQEALVRVDNKTYGICRETGVLISKERLRSVPHATLNVNAPEKIKGRTHAPCVAKFPKC